jgi:hypothetical protein
MKTVNPILTRLQKGGVLGHFVVTLVPSEGVLINNNLPVRGVRPAATECGRKKGGVLGEPWFPSRQTTCYYCTH